MKNLPKKLVGIFLMLATGLAVAGDGRGNLPLSVKKAIVKRKNELLAVVDKPKLFSNKVDDEKYFIVSLESVLVQEIYDALRSLGIDNYFINNLLILGATGMSYNAYVATFGKKPYAIIINSDYIKGASSFNRKFTLLHEAGHVKHMLERSEICGDYEFGEVVADVYALSVLAVDVEKENYDCLPQCQFPYLSPDELIFYAHELKKMKQKNGFVDVIAYAKKIVADRKKIGYDQIIMQEVERLLAERTFALH